MEFHDRAVVASLKLHEYPLIRYRIDLIPRPRGRGLIEAPVTFVTAPITPY